MSASLRLSAALSASLVTLAGCTTPAAQEEPRIAASSSGSGATVPVHAFAQAACGGCHAVEPPWLSPNPQSPTFEDIANRSGLSEDSLGSWLKDAHNYPEVMDFDLDLEEAEAIASYMLTLRRDDYVRPPS